MRRIYGTKIMSLKRPSNYLTCLLFSVCILAQNRAVDKGLRPISIVGPSRISYPATAARRGFIIDISEDSCEEGYFCEDNLILDIFATESSPDPLSELRFSSSYGYFDLSLVDLTGDNIEEFVLVAGEGRGTNARSQTLTVWQRRRKKFSSLLSVPVSGPCGVSCDWEYERQFTDVNGDGIIDLRLVRKITGTVAKQDHQLIPREAEKDFVFDARVGKMVRFDRSTARH